MIRKIAILSTLLLYLVMAHAQIPNLTDQKLVDSLFILLPKAEGIVKVDILNQLALNLAPRSYDSSFQYASEALSLSEKLDYQKGKGIAIYNSGNSHYFIDDYKNAYSNYLKALRILEFYEPLKELGDLLFMLGALNQYIRNSEKLRVYYLRASKNFKAIGDSTGSIAVLVYLSRSYWYEYTTMIQIDSTAYKNDVNSMMDSALKYNAIMLHYYSHSRPKLIYSTLELAIADINLTAGVYYWTKTDSSGQSDSIGLAYKLKALEIAHEIKDTAERKYMEGICYADLIYYYYFIKKNHEKGKEYAKLAEERLKNITMWDSYSFLMLELGRIEIDQGNFKRAKKYLDESLNYSDTFLIMTDNFKTFDPTYRLWGKANVRRIRTETLEEYIALSKKLNDHKTSLYYKLKLEEEKRIMTLDYLNREMTRLQVGFEDEIQNQQIEMASKEKELAYLKLSRARLWFTAAGSTVVIVFLLFFLYFQRKKHTTEQNALLLKQKLLRSQMNPHFIFNSLSGIQNFIVTEKPTKASIYLSKFATLVRNILDSSVKEYVALEKEIITIENYLELQKIRYAGKFDFSIKTADAIDPETTMIPPMLAQPFIENAIEHGIVHSEKMGQIDVEFKLKNDVILFEVRDNGVGREKAKELEAHLEKDHQSMSTSITLERLAMLNKKRKHKIIFEITDLKDGDGNPAGTFVRFGIPLG